MFSDVDFSKALGPQLSEFGATVRKVAWDEGGRVHNWRRYVDATNQMRWTELSDEARGLLYLVANEKAEAEEWD